MGLSTLQQGVLVGLSSSQAGVLAGLVLLRGS